VSNERLARSLRDGPTLGGLGETKLDAAQLPREASPAEVAKESQYDKNDDDDPEQAHVSPFVGGFATPIPRRLDSATPGGLLRQETLRRAVRCAGSAYAGGTPLRARKGPRETRGFPVLRPLVRERVAEPDDGFPVLLHQMLVLLDPVAAERSLELLAEGEVGGSLGNRLDLSTRLDAPKCQEGCSFSFFVSGPRVSTSVPVPIEVKGRLELELDESTSTCPTQPIVWAFDDREMGFL
jgi:hypothetical protein